MGLELRPGCRRSRAAPGSPQPPRPGGGPRFFLDAAAAEGGLRYLAGDPREADPSSLPREAGLASGRREVDRTTLGVGRGLPSVLGSFLLLDRSPGRHGRGDGRSFLLARLGALGIRWCYGCGGHGTHNRDCPWETRADLYPAWCPVLPRARQPPCASHPWPWTSSLLDLWQGARGGRDAP